MESIEIELHICCFLNEFSIYIYRVKLLSISPAYVHCNDVKCLQFFLPVYKDVVKDDSKWSQIRFSEML